MFVCPLPCRYLKRIFRDLFERQSFEDDGVFDWDIIKRQQLAAGGDGTVELNADGSARAAGPGPGAGMMSGTGEGGAGASDPAYNNAASGAGVSGRAVAESGKADGGAGAAGDGSRQDDSAGDGREPGARRSIISSIR